MTRLGDAGRVHAFKLDRRGLARVFGELEAEVMEAVWTLPEPTVAEVCDELGEGAHYKTVMTVMNRLVDKGILLRRRDSRAYRYAAVDARETFIERVSRRVVEGLLQDFGGTAVASFVDAVDAVDPELLAQLERLVRARQATDAAGTGSSADRFADTDPRDVNLDGGDEDASPTAARAGADEAH